MKILRRPINACDQLIADGCTHHLKCPEGYLTYSVVTDPDFIFVENLEINKDNRGHGAGSKLLDRIKKLSNEYNIPVRLFAYPELGSRTQSELIEWYRKRGFKSANSRQDLLEYNPRKVEANMKITRKTIQAASDYRTFDGLSIDEVEESYPTIYYDYFYDIRNDVREVFLSKNPECKFVGVEDTEGKYYVYKTTTYYEDGEVDPGWYEVTFQELFNYLD